MYVQLEYTQEENLCNTDIRYRSEFFFCVLNPTQHTKKRTEARRKIELRRDEKETNQETKKWLKKKRNTKKKWYEKKIKESKKEETKKERQVVIIKEKSKTSTERIKKYNQNEHRAKET